MSEPLNVPTAPIEDLTKSSILDELNKDDNSELISLDETVDEDDDDEKEDNKSSDKENEEEKEDDELKKIEEDLDDEEKVAKVDDEGITDDLIAPVKRREILAKYPKLFKEFPYLERSYYRNQQFTEVFSRPAEAKAARDKSESFDNFEQYLMSGETENILKAVKEAAPGNFNKLVDNYLHSLAKVDHQAANHVTANVIKHTVRAMIKEAKESGDDSYEAAAVLLNKFIFRTSEIQAPSNLSKQEDDKSDPREQQFRQREYELAQSRYNEVVEDIGTRVDNSIKATIDANIDTKEIMSDYIREKASKDAYDMVQQAIQGDKQFRSLIDRLYKKAFEQNYSKESKDAIRSAFVTKAKTLLPTVIKQARNKALVGMGKRVRTDSTDKKVTKSPNKDGVTKSPNTGKAKEVPKGMSTLEFLSQD